MLFGRGWIGPGYQLKARALNEGSRAVQVHKLRRKAFPRFGVAIFRILFNEEVVPTPACMKLKAFANPFCPSAAKRTAGWLVAHKVGIDIGPQERTGCDLNQPNSNIATMHLVSSTCHRSQWRRKGAAGRGGRQSAIQLKVFCLDFR